MTNLIGNKSKPNPSAMCGGFFFMKQPQSKKMRNTDGNRLTLAYKNLWRLPETTWNVKTACKLAKR